MVTITKYIKGDTIEPNRDVDLVTFGIHEIVTGFGSDKFQKIEVYGDRELRDKIITLLNIEEAETPFQSACAILNSSDSRRFEAVRQLISYMKYNDVKLITDFCLSTERTDRKRRRY